MPLHEALLHTECPICLQPLDCRLRPPRSHPASPLSPATAGSAVTSASNLYSSETTSPLQLTGPGNSTGGGGEFRVTFAPGVYVSDAADPWDPRLAVSAPGSPRDGSPLRHGDSGGDYRALPPPFGTEEAAAGVVVLPCGHLLHYLCAMQLCEYAAHLSCPVCRLKLASGADMILFRPRLRVPSAAASVPEALPLSPSQQGGGRVGDSTSRKRARAGASGVLDRVAVPVPDGLDEDSNSVQLVASSAASVLEGGDGSDVDVVRVATAGAGGGSSPGVPPPRHDANGDPSAAAAGTRISFIAVADAEDTEADITIVGARQLPPSQAYAEMLLRATTTWAARTDTLRARVEHLEKSQQQLQSDCGELERTLAVARRRREMLLNVPSSKDSQDALQSMQRLRELRHLCLETRTSMTTTTAQLADAVRDHAELRRQTDKYTRKLARLECGKSEDGADEVDALAVVAAHHLRRRHAAADPPQ